VHNVTQFVQFLVSGHLEPARKMFDMNLDKEALLGLAKDYSEDMTDGNLKRIKDELR
jgi:hypothetical protein